MFDFPSNAIDYLHRTGRTARMGAKGKVTSLITKKDLLLATRIEEAIKGNESLESLTAANVRQDVVKPWQISQKGSDSSALRMSKSSKKISRNSPQVSARKAVLNKTGKKSTPSKASKPITLSKPKKSYSGGTKRDSSEGRKSVAVKSTTSKLRVVGFRGRSSSGKKESPRPA